MLGIGRAHDGGREAHSKVGLLGVRVTLSLALFQWLLMVSGEQGGREPVRQRDPWRGESSMLRAERTDLEQ